ncbi:Mismatch repair protein msh3 [Coemansia sp. RSA 1813]|nr:Mismatch repair protein msh3 [Coemansia sp. RSA 1843]KAJ2088652.1 Mismatch repair protein msh3 [Coemansia sp. RSA 986]KAJ2213141.1 Mismatch repair protein msh3 [Coemansia sp. RSA 487]KAJ2568551.1 Mismatch repair protein msh3 [Coemansia sp. RSA 1813]
MSSSKRVQASLSSFFKPKQQKQQVTTASVSASVSDISLSQSPPPVRTRQNVSELRSDNSTKRRRVLSSEECSLGDKDDEGYVEDRVDSASSKQSKPPKGDKTSFTFSKRRSTGQSAGETLVKSVSDTTNMMQRLRMRIAGTKESEGSSAASQTLAPAGTLDQTSIQLVQRKKGTKYTPLEIQVLEAKEQHPDILLAVEVGYKYRFFGEDARIASRVLGIMCTTANNFYNASIPTPRLMVHVRRLVHAGYKVGVMRQAETAALKAISDNKNAPFSRKLADVYTSGTLVEEVGDSPHSESSSEKYLMCITEGPIESNDKRVNIGMLAVQITTGDIVYDCFEDGYLRSALETRLMHLQPGEIIIPACLSTETLKSLSGYVGYSIKNDESREPLLEHANRTGVRVSFADLKFTDTSAASSAIIEFYTKNNANSSLSYALNLPALVSTALAMTLDYLDTFNLTHVMLVRRDNSNNESAPKELFAPFHTRLHMLLSATTLQTLNIFTVSGRTSNSEQSAIALKELLKPGGRIAGGHSSHVKDGDGSLFSIMDFTRSQFGRRMLRRWIAHPLVSQERLMGRIEAVEFLKNAMEDSEGNNVGNSLSSHEPKQVLARMHNKIGQLVDIERGLCRIHYGQASPQELLRILRSLMAAVSLVPVDVEISEPRLLAETLDPDIWSNDLREAVLSWTNQIDYQSAKSGRKNTLFSRGPLYDMLQECHCRVEQVDSELAASIGHVRSVLKDESIEFKSISGIDYLIDIKNTKAKTVPLDWVKVSGTKSNSRFHTPYIINKLAERERCREALQQSAKNAYKTFLAGISEKYSELRQLVGSLATLDALFSLAMLARREGYCKPEFVNTTENDCASINLADAVNPVLGSTAVTYVPNVISLGDPDKDSNAPQAMILTGPNAGGKSSLIRTVALTSIMAQCGSFVPASHARLSIIDAIFTRMGASDNLMAGESTFMVEMRETQELMRQATPRSLAILDELGRGTSTHDGAAIAYAVLDHLVRKGVLTFFVTHYAHLVDAFAANKAVRSCHMSYIERSRIIAAKTTDSGSETSTETETTCSDITFLYKLAEGASADSFGLNVARIAGLPEPLLLRAKERASWMRAEIESKWASKHARDLRHAVSQAYAAST